MKDYAIVNELIVTKMNLPIEVRAYYDKGDFEISGSTLKISLGGIFYYSSEEEQVLVDNEKIFKALSLGKLVLHSMIVEKNSILVISFHNCLILAFPREIEGWGICLSGEQFVAHHGWQRGVDW